MRFTELRSEPISKSPITVEAVAEFAEQDAVITAFGLPDTLSLAGATR